MPPRDEEPNEGWFGIPLLEADGEEMCLHMVYRDEWFLGGVCGSLRPVSSNEECPDQPRSCGRGVEVDLVDLEASLLECGIDDLGHGPDMGSCGELGYYSTI